MKKYILALDQGTSSCRAVLLNHNFEIVNLKQTETHTSYPRSGWVEQDALEIWQKQLQVMQDVINSQAVDAAQIAALGITNQRETTLVWDNNGVPVYPAIIWQDTRTAQYCTKLKNSGLADYINESTGLVINPYFSATKLAWILDHVPEARTKAARAELHFGTIDSWLIWNLTGGRMHITDISNASRTMLFDINNQKWDEKILEALDIPPQILPQVVSSSALIGYIDQKLLGSQIPICGIAGDQQAALYGQRCWQKGMAKNTYGTGCFMLMNTGTKRVKSSSGLLSTIAWKIDGTTTYALEGSVFMAGAVIKWLRDELGLINSAQETEALALSLPHNQGVYFVPAFAGLGAPHWNTAARGLICGLANGCSKAHIVRAALESLAFQTRDVIVSMEKDSGLNLKELHVDGGAAANDFLMQFQADILGCPVDRPWQVETTVIGAGMLAARACGFGELSLKQAARKIFSPQISAQKLIDLCEGWQQAVARCSL